MYFSVPLRHFVPIGVRTQPTPLPVPAPSPTPTVPVPPPQAGEADLQAGFRPPQASEAELAEQRRWETVPVVRVLAEPRLLSQWELLRLIEFEPGKPVSYEQAQRSIQNLLATDSSLARLRGRVHRFGELETPLVVTFSLKGQEFMALNGGPHFRLSEAASIMAHCEDQAEIDRLWNALLDNGGQESQCGWLKDRWGVSWQIVPANLGDLFYSDDATANQRAQQAMFGMKKLDVAALKAARAAS